MNLRVLSYNIHKGFSVGNLSFVLGRVRESIRETQADLVFLQEVLGSHEGHKKRVPGWPEQSQFEFLADSVWSHFAYGKNAVYSEGHHGNAILSKYPITKWENIDISNSRFERRGILHAVIEVPGKDTAKTIHAICLHFSLSESARAQQIESLCERIEDHVPHGEPLIIGGDFNDWWQTATPLLEEKLGVREAFRLREGDHARTFPSWLPALRLDRIYFRGLEVVDAKRLAGAQWTELSDHVPLYAELKSIRA